jgi:DtxR family Mn-dependent transcriptional regulator
MTDPRLALSVFFAITAIILAVLWPRYGILSRFHRLRRASERVRVEDTLKYLFHRSASSDAVHPDALAGALEIRRSVARRILERLIVGGLAVPQGDGYRLTVSGRADALRIVRSHRLLERYFADRTGVAPAEWHELAEAGEHELSPNEVETLAARLGQPRFDPHGDPIPTATGELPAQEGMPLAHLADGVAGTVVHLEDEPREDYEQLLALGLGLGQQVVKRGRSSEVIALEVDGRALSLPIELADSVNVEEAEATASAPVRTLAQLRVGETAVVRRLSIECRGAQRRRLLDLGVVPGTAITSEMRSASGDPTAYRIRGALIALRRQQAEWIVVDAASAEVAA